MRRNPDDKQQIRIAVHELGHAVVWKHLGLPVPSVTHVGDDGETHVRVRDSEWREFAIGLWAGYEAEVLWGKAHRLGGPSRSSSRHDIERFRQITKGHSLSEGAARSQARAIVKSHMGRIDRLAPDLIRTGRLSGSQI